MNYTWNEKGKAFLTAFYDGTSLKRQKILSAKTHVSVKNIKENVSRFTSIDILRGAIMLLMALDHVRHFIHAPAMIDEPTNLATTTPVLFFTRWITHFCAPVFLFLSGIAAFISSQKKTKKKAGLFLIKRGLWLVIAELLVVTFSLSFNPSYNIFFLQVLWAIGWSMVILGLLIRTSLALIAITGLALVAGHNLLDYFTIPSNGTQGLIWKIFLTGKMDAIALGANRTAFVMYAVLPWTGIMLLGYAFGQLYRRGYNPAKRKNILLNAGIFTTSLFIALRMTDLYGDPAAWEQQRNSMLTVLSFFNVTKYPVSLQYTCMTLGPALIVLPLLENVQNKLTAFASVFGKVPFFYYVLHFFLVHIICALFFFISGHGWNEVFEKGSWFYFRPIHFGFDLQLVYITWLAVIMILYKPCQWFARYKNSHRKWWLNYV